MSSDNKTSPEHFRALLKNAGLSQTEAAKQMRVSRRSVVEWCKDGGKQQAPYLARAFLEMQSINYRGKS